MATTVSVLHTEIDVSVHSHRRATSTRLCLTFSLPLTHTHTYVCRDILNYLLFFLQDLALASARDSQDTERRSIVLHQELSSTVATIDTLLANAKTATNAAERELSAERVRAREAWAMREREVGTLLVLKERQDELLRDVKRLDAQLQASEQVCVYVWARVQPLPYVRITLSCEDACVRPRECLTRHDHTRQCTAEIFTGSSKGGLGGGFLCRSLMKVTAPVVNWKFELSICWSMPE